MMQGKKEWFKWIVSALILGAAAIFVWQRDFERDVIAGRSPTVQLNVYATRMTVGSTGKAYIQTIQKSEIDAFVKDYRSAPSAAEYALRPARPGDPVPRRRVFRGVAAIPLAGRYRCSDVYSSLVRFRKTIGTMA